MRVRPIHSAALAAGALLASPALAEDYPLPALSAAAYSETSYESRWDDEGEVIYVDELDEGEEWHPGDYDDRPDYNEVRR